MFTPIQLSLDDLLAWDSGVGDETDVAINIGEWLKTKIWTFYKNGI